MAAPDVRASRQDTGGSWGPKLHEMMVASVDVAGIGNIVDELREAVCTRYGANPHCQLRVCGYHPGESNNRALDFTRVITPSSGMGGDPNLSLVRALLSEERAQKTQLVELLVNSLVTKEASLQTCASPPAAPPT